MKTSILVASAALGLVLPLVPANKSWAQSPYPVVCGDWGTSTWGTGRVCWQGDRWWVTVRDTKTDGYCVSGVRSNGSRIARSCSSDNSNSEGQSGTRYVRLVRDDGRYLTLDVTS